MRRRTDRQIHDVSEDLRGEEVRREARKLGGKSRQLYRLLRRGLKAGDLARTLQVGPPMVWERISALRTCIHGWLRRAV